MVEHPTILKPTIVETMVNFEKKSTIFKRAQFVKYQSDSSFWKYCHQISTLCSVIINNNRFWCRLLRQRLLHALLSDKLITTEANFQSKIVISKNVTITLFNDLTIFFKAWNTQRTITPSAVLQRVFCKKCSQLWLLSTIIENFCV